MENIQYKILLVDDEPDIIEFLTYNLGKEGFKVYSATNGIDAIKMAKNKKPHLILLDVMMPKMGGLEACKKIREIPKLSKVIIVFLTARGEDYSQIAGFENGADEYITKPITPKLLIIKLKALLKRYNYISDDNESSKKIVIGDFIIDKEKYLVLKNGQQIILPKKEFKLFALLASKPEKVFEREEIFSSVWGDDIIVGDRTIDVHIRKLREKLGNDYIKTVKGVGYKFVE